MKFVDKNENLKNVYIFCQNECNTVYRVIFTAVFLEEKKLLILGDLNF